MSHLQGRVTGCPSKVIPEDISHRPGRQRLLHVKKVGLLLSLAKVTDVRVVGTYYKYKLLRFISFVCNLESISRNGIFSNGLNFVIYLRRILFL